jgi:uncharacterized membrane protein
MTYDIHPIFVHFPIALLVIYSAIKTLPLKTWFPRVAWKDIERTLLVLGTLGAFAALATGEVAEEMSRPNERLVEAHETFATISTWLYVSLLVGELAELVSGRQSIFGKIPSSIQKAVLFVKKILTNTTFSKVIALLALIAISVTGLLGGVMVYGTTADPLAKIVLSILGISI